MALPFNPQSVSSLILWLDASDANSLVTSGNSVTQWRDKSIFQNHTAFTSTTPPIISSINSLSSVYFNSRSGNSQYFQGPLSTIGNLSFTGLQSTFYIFTVATMISTPLRGFSRSLVQIGSNAIFTDGTLNYQISTTQATLAVYENVNIQSTVNRGTTSNYIYGNAVSFNRPFQSMVASVNSFISTFELSMNGYNPSFSYNTTFINKNAIQYAIGGSLVGAADARNCWDGHIGEVLIYNINQSNMTMSFSNIQQIQGYLAMKWGLQDDLLTSHPFKPFMTSLNSIGSATTVDTTASDKFFTLPSSGTIQKQMVWLQGKNNYVSSSTFVPQLFESINYQSNSFVQLNSQSQNVNLVNNGNSNWTLFSRFEGDLSNIGYTSYSYYLPAVSTIGSNSNTYGYATVVNSNSTYLAVSAPFSNIGTSTAAGAVLIYSKNVLSDTWRQVQTIFASDKQASDNFGTSLAMSYDGNYIVAGVPFATVFTSTNAGCAYLYKKDAISDLWTNIQKITVTDLQNSMNLGHQLGTAISQDGRIIALAASNYNVQQPFVRTDDGAVFMFTKSATTDYWNQVQRITLSYQPDGGFGQSISMSVDGTYLVVGSADGLFQANGGSAHAFKKSTDSDQWNFLHSLKINGNSWRARIASSVYMSGDGNYIVTTTGFNNGTQGSSVFIYKKRATTDYYDNIQFTVPREFLTYGGTVNYFGIRGAMNYDGSLFILNADNPYRNAYFYKKQLNTDLFVQFPYSNYVVNLAGSFIESVAMDSNGDNFYLATGSNIAGRVCPYRLSSMSVTNANFSFINVDTSSQKGPILLPPASSVPGEYFWIKDIKNNASNNPVCISTPANTYLMCNYSALFFTGNNFCAQLQSDGISNYNLVNFHNGIFSTFSNSVNFIPFGIKLRDNTPNRTSTLTLLFTTGIGGFSIRGLDVSISARNISGYENIYFKSYDNQTILPTWWIPRTTPSGIGFYDIAVRIPYATYNYFTPYYLYWDSNYISQYNGFSTFDFFDDFSSCPNGLADSNRWHTVLKGAGTPSATQVNGLMTLTGSDNQNSSANLITRYPVFAGNKGRLIGSNNFTIYVNYLCTGATGTCIGLGTTSNLQDINGGQSDWSITLFENGSTYYSSTFTRHYAFRTTPGAAATIPASGCNLVTSYANSNTWETFVNYRGFITSNTYQAPTNVICNAFPSNLTDDLYLFVGQTSKAGFSANKLLINYVAGFVTCDLTNLDIAWGLSNDLTTIPYTR